MEVGALEHKVSKGDFRRHFSCQLLHSPRPHSSTRSREHLVSETRQWPEGLFLCPGPSLEMGRRRRHLATLTRGKKVRVEEAQATLASGKVLPALWPPSGLLQGPEKSSLDLAPAPNAGACPRAVGQTKFGVSRCFVATRVGYGAACQESLFQRTENRTRGRMEQNPHCNTRG